MDESEKLPDDIAPQRTRKRRAAPTPLGVPPPGVEGAAPAPPTDKKPRQRRGSTKVTPGQVKAFLAAGIVGLDFTVGMVAPKLWTEEDRLAKEETVCLVDAIYAELNQSDAAMRLIQRLMTTSVHVQLAAAIIGIAAPRLARREIIPVELAIGASLAAGVLAGSGAAGVAGAVETGAAPSDSRGYGNGQEHAGEPPVGRADVSAGVPVETGRREMAGVPADQNGSGNGRHPEFPAGSGAEAARSSSGILAGFEPSLSGGGLDALPG